MDIKEMDYTMERFSEENVAPLLESLGLNTNNYFIAMTLPSMLDVALFGHVAQFFNRFCIFCFSETEINLIMLSRVSNKKVTELIKIDRSEISNMKFSDILISYKLNMVVGDSTMKFQIYKKVSLFTKIKNSIKAFRELYNL